MDAQVMQCGPASGSEHHHNQLCHRTALMLVQSCTVRQASMMTLLIVHQPVPCGRQRRPWTHTTDSCAPCTLCALGSRVYAAEQAYV